MIRAYSSWNTVSQNIIIFPKINKKRIFKTEKFKFFKVCSFMRSILGRGSSAQTAASVRCGVGAIRLWHCWGVIEPSARLCCWIDCFSSFSWKYPIDSRQGSGQACWLANQGQLYHGQQSTWVVLALWGGAKVLLENEISISIKLDSRWKHKVLQDFLVEGCIDFGLDKTQWTNTSRWHGSPNHHRLWKLHTGLQTTWILWLSSLPPDSRPWFTNERQNVL